MRSPDKYNNILFSNTSSTPTKAPTQDSLLSHIEAYKNTILDEANRLYGRLLKNFTNSIMDNLQSQ